MRSVARWAAGIVLLWGTFAMLWMPWADYQKSYRSVALQLRSKIPVGATCIAQRGLGVSQAAALDYHGGIRRSASTSVKPHACPLLLVQGSPQHEFDAPGPAAGPSSPTSAGPATAPSATASTASANEHRPRRTECKAWAKLAHHAESWRGVHLREPLRRRRRARRAVRRRSARACATTTRASASAR